MEAYSSSYNGSVILISDTLFDPNARARKLSFGKSLKIQQEMKFLKSMNKCHR